MSNKNLLNEAQVRQFMKLAKLAPLAQGFVQGLTETTDSEPELEESHGRGKGEGDAGYGHPDNNSRLEEEEDLEAQGHDLEDAEHDLDHADDLEDDAAEDLSDVGLEADGAADQMISVQDLMDALTAALEEVTGQPVESEIEDAPVEDEVEMDVELDAAADMEADTDMEMDGEMLAEEEGSKKGEYRRKDKDGKVGHRAGEGKDGHYKDYEGPAGGNKGDKSKTDPGHKDYEKNESTEATDELVEQITKRVAARILKSALAKK